MQLPQGQSFNTLSLWIVPLSWNNVNTVQWMVPYHIGGRRRAREAMAVNSIVYYVDKYFHSSLFWLADKLFQILPPVCWDACSPQINLLHSLLHYQIEPKKTKDAFETQLCWIPSRFSYVVSYLPLLQFLLAVRTIICLKTHTKLL